LTAARKVANCFPLVSLVDRTVTPDAASYPRRLRAAHGDEHVLHVRGTVAEPTLAAAIVGARAATTTAMRAAHELARGLAATGATVISGGALGVDAGAHAGALAAGGPTIAVLACGLDIIYPPRHAGLFDRIVAGGGAVVTTFPAGTPPKKGHFVARNSVIAALADVVIVVEAGAASGALHTARAAVALGRPVGAMGDSPGVRRLHAAGAAVIDTADDVIALAAGRARRPSAAPVDDRARAVAVAIGTGADADTIAERTGLTGRAIACALLDLEAAGWVRTLPGGRHVLTAIAPLARDRQE
jgi:DNA processing protein